MRWLEAFEGFDRSAQLRRARASSALTATLTPAEADLLGRISTRVHRHDSMYLPGQAEHYLSVGLSAARVLGAALQAKPTPSVGSVLDFPCGYGRVLRFLKAMFPEASVTGAEIDADALRFCRRVFGIDAIRSGPDFRGIAMPRRFDVIWCGSLVTHFDERSTTALLSMFFEWLDESGVCVLTTHGRLSAEWIRSGSVTYGLPTAAQRTVLAQYDGDGYGYADLDGSPGYGISLVSRDRMGEVIAGAGAWRESAYLEGGWDAHQDVYALVKRSS